MRRFDWYENGIPAMEPVVFGTDPTDFPKISFMRFAVMFPVNVLDGETVSTLIVLLPILELSKKTKFSGAR